jgi:hypothetical protein
MKDETEFAPSQRQTGKWCRACCHAEYVKRRPASPALERRLCFNCGQWIENPKHPAQRFCSLDCKRAKYAREGRADFERRSSARQCQHCGASLEGRRTDAVWCSQRCANWAKGNRPAISRRARLKGKYGLTVEQFDAMLADQGGTCAICGTDQPGTKGWCVDHCHHTGRVRGVLCTPCNTGIGQMKDDPARLRAAAAYLERKP